MKLSHLTFTLQKLFSEISILHEQTLENVKVSDTTQCQSDLSKAIHAEIQKIKDSLVTIKNLTNTIGETKSEPKVVMPELNTLFTKEWTDMCGKMFGGSTAEPVVEEKDSDLISVYSGDTDMFTGTREQFADCFFSNATNDQIIGWCKTEIADDGPASLWINGKILVGESTEIFEALTFWYQMSPSESFDMAIREHNNTEWLELSNEKLIETYNKHKIK